MALKTNYKDAVFSGERKYQEIFNPDGTKSFTDRTSYTTQGDRFGANDINATNRAVNALANSKIVEIKAASWAPTGICTQRVNIPEMKATDTPIVSHYFAGNVTDANLIKRAWKAYSCVDMVETFDGYMVLTCYRKRPTDNFLILVKGVGVNG
jgi:hypothetical protein|nr:MAG TPA: hypothetical protein [Caudoviricetes sp.]